MKTASNSPRAAADPLLRSAYGYCRRLLLLTHEGRQVLLASYLAPAHRRPGMWAVYGLLRHGDHIIDRGDPATHRRDFEAWAEHLLDDLRLGRATDPLARALGHAARTWDMDLKQVERLIETWRSDFTVTEFATYEDLCHYLDGIGGPMFDLLASVICPPGTAADPRFVAVSRAFYFTTMIRDLREDLALGRVYLPMEDLDRFGVTVSALRTRRVTPEIRQLTAFQVDRARSLLAEATGAFTTHADCRLLRRAGLSLIPAILDEVERCGYDALTRKPQISIPRTLGLLLSARLTAPR